MRAGELLEGRADGVGQFRTIVELQRDQMGDDLGVGVGRERMTCGQQPVAKLGEVVGDAVVDDHHAPGAVTVWMRIRIGDRAMRRPPGVADADGAVDGFGLHQSLEIVQAPSPPPHADAFRTQHGQARRVVAPVLERTQAGEDVAGGRLMAEIPDDAAHPQTPEKPRLPARLMSTIPPRRGLDNGDDRTDGGQPLSCPQRRVYGHATRPVPTQRAQR